MAFYYLLLGHLIGDFVLQTDKIAENKCKYWKWNLLHVLVVTLCTLAFSYQYGNLLVFLVLINGAVHFFLDCCKASIGKLLNLNMMAGFLADQLIHIMLLYLISLTAVYKNPHLIDFMTVRFMIVLAIVTSFAAIFSQFLLKALFPRNDNRFFEDGEKNTGILARIYITIVFYLSFFHSPYFLLLLPGAAAVFFLQFKLKWNKWMSPLHLITKLFLDAAISAACIFLFIYL